MVFAGELQAEPKRPMSEAEYWVHLEFRLCREFAGLSERRYRHFWCDGLLPEQYILTGPSPRVCGKAWICNGPEQFVVWEFTLLLRQSPSSPECIDWSSLLPADDVTRWMSFDEEKRCIEIDPAAAEPDLA